MDNRQLCECGEPAFLHASVYLPGKPPGRGACLLCPCNQFVPKQKKKKS